LTKAIVQICSLLPSATEILYALGLGDAVVGVTHECDFPPEAAKKPPLIRPRVDPQASPAVIDRQVTERVSRGESIYSVDAALLASLAPDLIITQDLCHVCAASPEDLATALTRFSKRPKILSLAPHTLADVWRDIRCIGEATGRRTDAQGLAITLEQKVAAIEMKVVNEPRPRALCLEWMDPFYIAGHWVPEMVAKAGGEDVLGHVGKRSFRATPEQIAETGTEIIVVMPCGYNSRRAAAEFSFKELPSSWDKLPAIRDRRVFAVDANSYFSRPGPRLADGIELLAHLFHPQIVPLSVPSEAFQNL
jgi:iron complex transport system substrate-binding protein